MLNNQLPTNSHVQLDDNSNTVCLFPEHFSVFHDSKYEKQEVICKPTSIKPYETISYTFHHRPSAVSAASDIDSFPTQLPSGGGFG